MTTETEIVFREGEQQHFIREEGNSESRLIFRGELQEVCC